MPTQFNLLALEDVNGGSFLKYARALTMCALYMVCGPMLIVINQNIMKEHGFPYPMALSALGLVSSSAVARVAVTMGWAEIRDSAREAVKGPEFWSKLAPVGASYAFTLGCGNAAYLYLDVGFLQMMKVSILNR
jgi:hypothetical protein